MWIVSVDETYYPYILKFDSYSEAKSEYERLKQILIEDGESWDDGEWYRESIFISRVEEFATNRIGERRVWE